MDMPEEVETIIYDTMIQIQRNCKPIVELINERGTDEQKNAYQNGMYAVVVRLSMCLGHEAMDKHKARHAEIDRMLKACLEIDS